MLRQRSQWTQWTQRLPGDRGRRLRRRCGSRGVTPSQTHVQPAVLRGGVTPGDSRPCLEMFLGVMLGGCLCHWLLVGRVRGRHWLPEVPRMAPMGSPKSGMGFRGRAGVDPSEDTRGQRYSPLWSRGAGTVAQTRPAHVLRVLPASSRIVGTAHGCLSSPVTATLIQGELLGFNPVDTHVTFPSRLSSLRAEASRTWTGWTDTAPAQRAPPASLPCATRASLGTVGGAQPPNLEDHTSLFFLSHGRGICPFWCLTERIQ